MEVFTDVVMRYLPWHHCEEYYAELSLHDIFEMVHSTTIPPEGSKNQPTFSQTAKHLSHYLKKFRNKVY